MATKKNESKELATKPETKNELANTTQQSPAERFTTMVVKEFAAAAGGAQKVSDYQRKLAQHYFIKIDQMLKDNEQKRLAKDEQYREPLSFEWKNVNMPKLALDVMLYSSLGLDPVQNNHLSFICYKNKHINKFDVGFIPGYKGLELKAKKYGIDLPADIVFEVVYSTDKFKELKRNHERKIEGYEFEITNSFDRGNPIGGFYYMVFADPSKNKLVVFDMKDIEKRKPKYASAEFWGGEKDKWEKGKKVGTETIEGWIEEMIEKTLKRAAWNSIVIDPKLVDDNYMKILEREADYISLKAESEIDANANKEPIGFTEVEDITQTEPQTNEQANGPVPQVETELSEEDKKKAAAGELGF